MLLFSVKLFFFRGEKCVCAVGEPVTHLQQSSAFASPFQTGKTHCSCSRDVARYLPAIHQDQYLSRFEVKNRPFSSFVMVHLLYAIMPSSSSSYQGLGFWMEDSQLSHHVDVWCIVQNLSETPDLNQPCCNLVLSE